MPLGTTKVVPVDGPSEDEAAAKVQAVIRGRNARAAAPPKGKRAKISDPSSENVDKMEQRMRANTQALTSGKLGGSKKWGRVKEATGIKFDSWDMALQVVDAGWRGELAREVQRKVEEKIPDNPWAKAALVFIAYWTAWFCLRDDMAPPDNPFPSKGFAVVLIWVCSTLGGKLMGKIGMPGLLGNLLSGVILKNAIAYPGGTYNHEDAVCPPAPGCSASSSGSISGRMLAGGVDYSHPHWCITKSINGLPDDWASDIITFGLTIIFMRGGLELDIDLIKKALPSALYLTFLPGVCEALMVAVFSMFIFNGMGFTLGCTLGFILAAVSPAVVVGAMFDLKKRGYGVKQNIPTLVVAAASMDDVVAISGFATFVAIAIPPAGATTTTWVLIGLHTPIALGLAVLFGIIGGNIAAMTTVWDKPWKRVAIVALQGFFLSFCAKKLEREWYIANAHPVGASAGILGALAMSGVTSYMWERGKGYASSGPEKHFAHDTEATLAKVWALLAQPLLFGVVGSYLDFRKMAGISILKAILTVFIGVSFRTVAAFLALMKAGLSKKEQLFVALSWLPKATVQAAFCSYPADKIRGITDFDFGGNKTALEWEQDFRQWGEDIMVTGGLAILLTAPLGLIIIQKLGPKWLEQDKSQGMEKSIDDMVEKELKERQATFSKRPA